MAGTSQVHAWWTSAKPAYPTLARLTGRDTPRIPCERATKMPSAGCANCVVTAQARGYRSRCGPHKPS
jgi:hypothetical protein